MTFPVSWHWLSSVTSRITLPSLEAQKPRLSLTVPSSSLKESGGFDNCCLKMELISSTWEVTNMTCLASKWLSVENAARQQQHRRSTTLRCSLAILRFFPRRTLYFNAMCTSCHLWDWNVSKFTDHAEKINFYNICISENIDINMSQVVNSELSEHFHFQVVNTTRGGRS